MPKYPLIFLLLLLISNAYALDLELNQRVYAPNDRLVIFGTAIPNDSLILELFNPTGNLIYRSQIDVNSNGEFADIILIWPEADDSKFRVGTYTLVLTSSINRELKISEAIIYQLNQQMESKEVINRIGLDLAAPSIIELDKSVPIIAYVTLNDTPLIGLEMIEATIRYPDDTSSRERFIAIGNGFYEARFSSSIEGYHSIIVEARHRDLITNKAIIIDVEDNPIVSVDRTVNQLKQEMDGKMDELDKRLSNNTLAMMNDIESINRSMESISSSIGQLTSLLLPIIGMIAVIVALQATILARRQ